MDIKSGTRKEAMMLHRDALSKEPEDVSACEWSGMEGVDVAVGTQMMSLTYGQADALIACIMAVRAG